MNDKFGASAKSRLGIGVKKSAHCVFNGEVTLRRGDSVKTIKNTIQDTLKFKSIQGVAEGGFAPINRMYFCVADICLPPVPTTIIAGGTGNEDYITFKASYTNEGSQNITIIELKLASGTTFDEYIHSIVNVSETLAPGETLIVEWKITFSLESGTLQPIYRYLVARMLGYGSFYSPNMMAFDDTSSGEHFEVAELEDGGDGTVNWARWGATFTATETITIDIIRLTYQGEYHYTYTSDDIIDKTLEEDQYIIFHVTITHN